MILASLFALVALFAVAGVAITLFIGRNIPLEVLDQAQRHGRFAHLGQDESRGGPARAVRVTQIVPARTGGLRTA